MNSYLPSILKQFQYYKSLGDKTLDRLSTKQLFWQPDETNNSIAIIAKHLVGNMLSRWTNFLTEDGEKPWRNRDNEFMQTFKTKEELIAYWNKGWDCLYTALTPLSETDLEKQIFIRNLGHTVVEAINRQLCHYSYHIGQMVFLGKLILKEDWQSLSIPKGASKEYNQEKFKNPKRKEHFTDDL